MSPEFDAFPDSIASGSMINEINNGVNSNGKVISVDSLLASELNKLSFHERESINDEIHGINIDRKYIEESGAVEETPELLAKSLDDLQIELDRLCATEGGVGGIAFAFQRSQELYGTTPEGTYFNTTDFRLMFIRCDRFDCQKAAIRICRFAELHHEIYGDFALQRPIKLSDHNDDEVAVIKDGFSHILGRDRAGRRIYMYFGKDYGNESLLFRLRVPGYMLMKLVMNDVESQKRGIVAVMWMHKVKTMNVNDFIKRGYCQGRQLRSLPIRLGAGHYCFPSIRSAKDVAFSHLLANVLARTSVIPHIRVHSGTPTENLYTLESFGIASKLNPLNIATDEVDLKNHTRWLKLCVAREENPTRFKHIIECPNHSDILFGRGQIVMNHPGNSMFRDFIHSNLEVYSNIQTKKESTQWTWSVVRKLKTEHGARFLKEERIENDLTSWVEVSNEIARSKVRIAFRDARTRLTKLSAKETKVASYKPKYTRKNGHASNSASPTVISSSSSTLSKRKKGGTMSSDDFSPLAAFSRDHDQPSSRFGSEFETINSNLNTINDNIIELNSNLNSFLYQQQVNNSSTSKFLGLDGSDSKRQRLDHQNQCFDCF